jgi:hypothetical protein
VLAFRRQISSSTAAAADDALSLPQPSSSTLPPIADLAHAPGVGVGVGLGVGDPLHPGLVSAVLMLGCHFASLAGDARFSVYEEHYLQQTRYYLAKSLTAAERLSDFLRGTALLVWFYFAKGRIAEAQYHASGASSFLVFFWGISCRAIARI